MRQDFCFCVQIVSLAWGRRVVAATTERQVVAAVRNPLDLVDSHVDFLVDNCLLPPFPHRLPRFTHMLFTGVTPRQYWRNTSYSLFPHKLLLLLN